MAYVEGQGYGGNWKWDELSTPMKVAMIAMMLPMLIPMAMLAVVALLIVIPLQMLAQGPKETWRDWKKVVRKRMDPTL